MQAAGPNTFAQGRDNHFNLIRFMAATLVLYSHCFPLTARGPDEPLYAWGLSWGQVAVAIFFVSSGFLVTGSWLRSASITAFFRARIVRIYPALIVANLFTVFVIGLYFTALPANEYLAHGDIYAYLKRNSLLFFHSLQYRLPGVFEQNPYAGVVNGSLWTLPREVKLYLQLGLIGAALRWLARWRRLELRYVLMAVVLGFAGATLTSPGAVEGHVYTRSELSLLFFSGALMYAWREHIRLDWRITATVILALLAMALLVPSSLPISVPRLAIIPALVWLVLFCAYRRARPLLAFNRLGDYSYGIYIYAFPVQQALVALSPSVSPWLLFWQAFAVVLALSIVSWHCIEKPALRFKRVRNRTAPARTTEDAAAPSDISRP